MLAERRRPGAEERAATPGAGRAGLARGGDGLARRQRRTLALLGGLALALGTLACWRGGVREYTLLRSGILRPVVGDADARQLLVVGTQSSATSAISRALCALGLEVGHETSNTAHKLCRDGTVSWFHSVRFLRPDSFNASSARWLCAEPRPRSGFNPRMWREPRAACPARAADGGACERADCEALLAAEWGCARAHAAGGSCETPFARSLLQVRHPLRVIESLAVKFCAGPDAPLGADLHGVCAALWPARAARGEFSHTCLGALAAYWAAHTADMLEAMRAGALHGAYRVETVDACAVARLGGFGASPGTPALHPPSAAAVSRTCAQRGGARARAVPRVNQRNRGTLRVSARVLDGVSTELGARVRRLALELGYTAAEYEAESPSGVEWAPVGAAGDGRNGSLGDVAVARRPPIARTFRQRRERQNDWREPPQAVWAL